MDTKVFSMITGAPAAVPIKENVPTLHRALVLTAQEREQARIFAEANLAGDALGDDALRGRAADLQRARENRIQIDMLCMIFSMQDTINSQAAEINELQRYALCNLAESYSE